MPAKASRKPLSRERVLAAAVALADTWGIQALTMRRLAADLSVEAMSLYYYEYFVKSSVSVRDVHCGWCENTVIMAAVRSSWQRCRRRRRRSHR
jgi:hypothetical protein